MRFTFPLRSILKGQIRTPAHVLCGVDLGEGQDGGRLRSPKLGDPQGASQRPGRGSITSPLTNHCVMRIITVWLLYYHCIIIVRLSQDYRMITEEFGNGVKA